MTNNQLIAYDKIDDVPGFVNQLGRSIALSKMFGCESEEQGHIIALECISRRMPPMSIAERFHLIHGKLSKKSEAMLAEFREVVGGSHKIVSRTPDHCAIVLTDSTGESEEFHLTWEQARQEPFVYDGKESTIVDCLNSGNTDKLKLKPKYSTPRARMQMLWSRLVSDSIRCVAPEIVCGTYTPEEVGDFDEMPAEVRNQPVVSEPENQPVEAAEVIEDATVVSTQQVEITTDAEQPAESSEPDEVRVDGPCLPHQIDLIKDALKRAKQLQPDVIERFRAFLAKNNLDAIADLTNTEAIQVLDAIEQKNVRAFFEADLRKHCPKN